MRRKISVIGLGYVGLTTASVFGQQQKVVGFDINHERIESLKGGNDTNGEISDLTLKNAHIQFTSTPEDLRGADFHIVVVPTPLDQNKQPDLGCIIAASKMLGKELKKGDIVVYESSVYPGATEEKCIPALEETSHLKCGRDFFVGFSPERINPADNVHTFENVPKIISATDNSTLDVLDQVFSEVVTAGVHRAPNIRVAEAAKVIENTQRDTNIAFMNEMAMFLHALNIDTADVIAAMKTKWNFIQLIPGLVGGHCIGVNSHYLMHAANDAGFPLELVTTTRRVNERMASFIADEATSEIKEMGIYLKEARVAVLGFTYKPDCLDLRDTKVIELIKILQQKVKVFVNDPIADSTLAKKEYDLELTPFEDLHDLDAIIVTVGHHFYRTIDKNILKNKLNRPGLLMDIQEIYKTEDFSDPQIRFWRL